MPTAEQLATETGIDVGQQTYGERAVGINFNPSADPTVHKLKDLYAHIIDACNDKREAATDQETKRLWSIAITEAQTAQMWAVKAATWRK